LDFAIIKVICLEIIQDKDFFKILFVDEKITIYIFDRGRIFVKLIAQLSFYICLIDLMNSDNIPNPMLDTDNLPSPKKGANLFTF